MSTLSIAALALFGAFFLVELGAARFGKRKIRYAAKPVLVPLLILFYISRIQEENWLIVAALGCSFLGDLFMMRQEREAFLLAGMAAFMACLICYAVGLLQPFSSLPEVKVWFFLLLIPYILYMALHYKILKPYLGDMRLPSIVYFAVLLAMSCTALLRVWYHQGPLFWLPFVGSLLFVASDTILGYHLFRYDGKSKHGDLLVGLTYFPAQLLLVLGFSLSA